VLKQLIHKGVLVPDPPEYQGLSILIDDTAYKLSPTQEEMAYAWAKKLDTPYVQDLVFVRNFMADFSRALGYEKPLMIHRINFGELEKRVKTEREQREALTKEERKERAAKRKQLAERIKEMYGFALADGERIELATYMTEPSGIFMGRGKHPLRGRWKEGARKKDVTLNLSPDAEIDRSEWQQVVWQPESLWVARWEDKLSGKLKYIWLHDTAPIKQTREAQKFDKATELAIRIEDVRKHIEQGLVHEDAKIRKIATACTLIDKLCLRVGDEKDPDEADTVGATTLRPEHIKIHDNGIVEFKFLGKDSVLWHKKIALPSEVITNLKELSANARPSATTRNIKKHAIYSKPQLFPDVSSRNVNAFLSQAMPGLSAKVFRTHHATHVVRENLDASNVTARDPEYKKWAALTSANTEAAILCNHTRQAPKNWNERKKKYKEREKNAQNQLKAIQEQVKGFTEEHTKLKKEAVEKKRTATDKEKRRKIEQQYGKRLDSVSKKIKTLKGREVKANITLGKLKAQMSIAMENRSWNLTTSQKSYIDPRVFYNWGIEVDYDVLQKYYSRTLRNKFQWVKDGALNHDLQHQDMEFDND
jgi:DNA topoisomerase I